MTSPFGTVVLEHFRRPRNQRTLAGATARHEAFNPLCGDRVLLELRIEGDVIAEAAFTASACAICTAAASLLTERVPSLEVARARALADDAVLGWLDAPIPVARAACATLPVAALRAALRDA